MRFTENIILALSLAFTAIATPTASQDGIALAPLDANIKRDVPTVDKAHKHHKWSLEAEEAKLKRDAPTVDKAHKHHKWALEAEEE